MRRSLSRWCSQQIKETKVRFPLIVLGSLLNILGVLWTLQSLSVIPGSMMAGQSSWVAAGGMALVAGAIVTAVGARAARRQQ